MTRAKDDGPFLRDTSDMFDQCLSRTATKDLSRVSGRASSRPCVPSCYTRVPVSEATLQTAIVPLLINMCGIILDSKTYAAAEAKFVSQCVVPLQFRPRNKPPNKIPLPHLEH